MTGEAVRARVGLVSALGLMYATACGGPYGTEDFVPKVGPGAFVLLLFVTPWLFGLPTAFATAELSARRSVAGGYYKWAQLYLGEFWGYQAGMWNLFMSFLDNALYPVLFAEALQHVSPDITRFERWLAAVGFILVLTWLNYRGIRVAGGTALALNAFLVAPLVWLVVAAAGQWRFNPLLPLSAPGTDLFGGLGACLALSIWLYSGYYEVSAAAEEIENPGRNIPLALLVLTPIVILSYALPTLAGLAATGGWQAWVSGQFAAIGTAVGGPLLGHWLFLGSVASQAVIFLAYLVWWSRLVWAMAANHHLPGAFAKLHPRYGTPHRVLLVYALAYSLIAALPFEKLLVADVWLTAVFCVLLQASLIRARKAEGPPPRGFRVPGGLAGVWTNATVPTLTCVLMLVLTARENFVLGTSVVLGAPLLYLMRRAWGGTPPARPVAEAG